MVPFYCRSHTIKGGLGTVALPPTNGLGYRACSDTSSESHPLLEDLPQIKRRAEPQIAWPSGKIASPRR